MIVRMSIPIQASPDEIWPYLVEPGKIMLWCITFKKFEYLGEQQGGVGTKIYIEEKAAGPLMKMEFETTEWAENSKVMIKKTAGDMPKSYTQEWMIQPENGGSQFTFQEEIVMPYGFIGGLIERVVKGSSENTVDKMLKILKREVES